MKRDKLQKCTFHPDIVAKGKCDNCGRFFCNLCLEEVEKLGGERCVECLSTKELKQRTRISKYLLLYVTGFLASFLLVISSFQSLQPPFLISALLGQFWWIAVMNWMQSKTPDPVFYMAIAAAIGFPIFAALDVRSTLRLRRSLPEHGFCPKCGSVLFGKNICPNCKTEIQISSLPIYPDITWLREYLRMKEKTVVDYEEEVAKRKKLLRTKYRRRKRPVEPKE
ncbi:MAG: hypothetical protein QW279_02780 [Candidatus Jordarchaeaceae archaeon]